MSNKKQFTTDDLRELEKRFFTDAQLEGLDVGNEDICDLMNTIMWATYEGDAEICYRGYEEEQMCIDFIKSIMNQGNFYYKIVYTEDAVMLELYE